MVDKMLDKIFSDIDNLRESIKQKSKEQWDNFNSLIQTREAKEKAELEAMKKEYGELLSDPRYPKFNQFISRLDELFTIELKKAIKEGKEYNIISGITWAGELLQVIKNHDKKIKDFLAGLKNG